MISGLESEKCAQTEGCEVATETFPPQCLPRKADNTGGDENTGADETVEGGGPADAEGGSDNGFFEIDNEECFRDPFSCCNNHFDEDSCSKRNDAVGDSMCAFIKGEDYSYCGGALCNQNLTLGATAITCPQISGCQWISNPGTDFCTFKDKCDGKNQTVCESFDSCQYGEGGGGTGVGGAGATDGGDSAGGRCDLKDTSSDAQDEDGCATQGSQGDCTGIDSCKWYADSNTEQEVGYCAPNGPDPCDDSVGSRAFNSTACEEVDTCKWNTGGGGGGAGSVSAGDGEGDLEEADTNCQRKDNTGSGDPGSGFTDGGSGSGGFSDGLNIGASGNECFDHDTTAECRRPLDKEGKPECTWVVVKEGGVDRGFCATYNKCGVATKQECQENGCAWSEKFDYNKGGTEGVCGHPPSTFDDGDGNYTCLPDLGGDGYTTGGYASYGGEYGGDDGGDDSYTGGGLFFGDDLEHVVTTTKTATTTTKTTITRTKTTTTVTSTTVTHKTEQATGAPDSNEVPRVDEETGEVTLEDAPIAGDDNFFDHENFAIDITFGNNFYTQLDEGQKRDAQVKTQIVVQSRMESAGMKPGKFKSAVAHGYIGRRRSRRSFLGTLIIRVEFNYGILPSEMNTITDGIIKRPVKFNVYGSNVNFASTFVGVIYKPGSPMEFPVKQDADDIRDIIEASVTTVAPSVGMSDAEIAALNKANREAEELAQALKDAVTEGEKCTDAEGNTLDETACNAVKTEGEKAVEEIEKATEEFSCDSTISGKPLPTATCLLINEADGREQQAKAAYIGCLGDLQNSIADCAATKTAYDAAKSATNALNVDFYVDTEELDELTEQANADAKKRSTMVIVIVIIVVILILSIGFAVYIWGHHAFNDVYGTAGMASYNNPVYGGAAPAGGDGGYLGAGAYTEYPKAGKKKGGLVRQESMC